MMLSTNGQLNQKVNLAVVQLYCSIPYMSMYVPVPPLNDFAFTGLGNFSLESYHNIVIKPLASQIKWSQSVASFWDTYQGSINMKCGITTATFPLPYNFSTYDFISSAELFECMDRQNFRGEHASGRWGSCENVESMFAMSMNQGNWSTGESKMSNHSSWPKNNAFYIIPYDDEYPVSPLLQDELSKIMSDGDKGPWDSTGPLFKIPFFLETTFPQGSWLNATKCHDNESQKVELVYSKGKIWSTVDSTKVTLTPFNCKIDTYAGDCAIYFRAKLQISE